MRKREAGESEAAKAVLNVPGHVIGPVPHGRASAAHRRSDRNAALYRGSVAAGVAWGEFPATCDAIVGHLRDVVPAATLAPLDAAVRAALKRKGTAAVALVVAALTASMEPRAIWSLCDVRSMSVCAHTSRARFAMVQTSIPAPRRRRNQLTPPVASS